VLLDLAVETLGDALFRVTLGICLSPPSLGGDRQTTWAESLFWISLYFGDASRNGLVALLLVDKWLCLEKL